MVLADDNFATLTAAVEEGRTIYDNLRKGIAFTLATSCAQALTIVVAITIGLQLPLTTLQILWVNMVTAVTLALALAFEPAEPDVMQRPPRDTREPLVSGALARHIVMAVLVISGLTIAVFVAATELRIAYLLGPYPGPQRPGRDGNLPAAQRAQPDRKGATPALEQDAAFAPCLPHRRAAPAGAHLSAGSARHFRDDTCPPHPLGDHRRSGGCGLRPVRACGAAPTPLATIAAISSLRGRWQIPTESQHSGGLLLVSDTGGICSGRSRTHSVP